MAELMSPLVREYVTNLTTRFDEESLTRTLTLALTLTLARTRTRTRTLALVLL